MAFLMTRVVQDQAISADGKQTFELSVNPLSFILLNLRPLNDTGTLSNFQQYFGICGALDQVRVLDNGVGVVSASGRDLAAMNYFRYGIVPPQQNPDDTNNDRRCVTLPVIMGRFPWDMESCFPARRHGHLVLELDMDIADTGYDGLRLTVDICEMLGATPSEYERKVTVSQTFNATGTTLLDLPVGNLIRGVLLFGTTAFTGASPAPTWGEVSTVLDGRQVGYNALDWEVAHMLTSLHGRQPIRYDAHQHRVDAQAASGTEQTDDQPQQVGSGAIQNYSYLEFDPDRTDQHAVNTANASRFVIEAEVEAAEAVRAIAVERVRV